MELDLHRFVEHVENMCYSISSLPGFYVSVSQLSILQSVINAKLSQQRGLTKLRGRANQDDSNDAHQPLLTDFGISLKLESCGLCLVRPKKQTMTCRR